MQKMPEIPYVIRETLRQMGLRPFVKWGVILSLAMWFLWPEVEVEKQAATPPPATAAAKVAPKVLTSTVTGDDLRLAMTAEQTAFRWESFQRVMQQGKEREPVVLNGGTVTISYVKDAAFKSSNGLNCRAFAEKLVVAGRHNLRKGIACEHSPGNWCRQVAGEKPECRGLPPTGFAAEMDAAAQDMQWSWDNNLRSFGF